MADAMQQHTSCSRIGRRLPVTSRGSGMRLWSAEHALARIDVNGAASNGTRTFRAQERYGERELVRPGLPLDRVAFERALGAVLRGQPGMRGVVADRLHEARIDVVDRDSVLAQPRRQ